MKIIEEIELRSLTLNRSKLKEKLKSIFKEIISENETRKISWYYRFGIDTDFCIQIIFDTAEHNYELSREALLLVNELKNYGLVNHSIWIEDEVL